MNKKEILPVIVVSCLLLVYWLLIFLKTATNVAMLIFAVSPLLVGWMVISVIRHGNYPGKELDEEEEWGYSDKKKDEIQLF